MWNTMNDLSFQFGMKSIMTGRYNNQALIGPEICNTRRL